MADNNETEVGVHPDKVQVSALSASAQPLSDVETFSQKILALAILDEAALEKLKVQPTAGTQTVIGELELLGLLTPFQAVYVRAGEFEKLRLDEYLLLDKIGEGGMGEVFRARNLSLDRVEAIKVIRGDSSPMATRRFQQEARALARLEHPGIVPVYRIGRHDGADFIAMKFVDGITLRDKLREVDDLGITIPVGQTCRWMVDAAEALGHAHRHGIIHRDVKPGNLMIASDGRIVVLDLGIAQLRDPIRGGGSSSLTQHSRGMGTPEFMPPEQWADARGVTPESDIYSLACSFFWVLTGKPAFSGDSITDLMRAHSTDAPPKPSSIRSDVPAALDAVFLRAMAKHPKDRFATMNDLVEAVKPFAFARQIVQTGKPRATQSTPSGDSTLEQLAEASKQLAISGTAWKVKQEGKSPLGNIAAVTLGLGCLFAIWFAGRMFESKPDNATIAQAKTLPGSQGAEAPHTADAEKPPQAPPQPSDAGVIAKVAPSGASANPLMKADQPKPAKKSPSSTQEIADGVSNPKTQTGPVETAAAKSASIATAPVATFTALRANAMSDDWSRHALESMRGVVAANALAANSAGNLQVEFVDEKGTAVERLKVGVAAFPKVTSTLAGFLTFVRFDGKELFVLPIDDKLEAGSAVRLKTRFSFSEPGRKRFFVYVSDHPLVAEPVLPDNAAEPTFPRIFAQPEASNEILRALDAGRTLQGAKLPVDVQTCRRVAVDLEVVP